MFTRENVEFSTFIYNDRDVRSMAQSLSELGIHDIELFGMDNCHWHRGDIPEAVQAILREYKIASKSMHLTVAPIALEAVRDQAMDDMLECLHFAYKIGAKKVVMHAGLIGKDATEEHKVVLAQAVRAIALEAEKLNIKLLIENLPDYGRGVYGGTFEDLLDIYKRSGGQNVFFCYDVGHARVNNQDMFADFEKSLGRIEAVHLSDNFGMISTDNKYNDAHLPPLEGDLPWDKLLKLFFNYPTEVTLTLEVSQRATSDSREAILKRTLIAMDKLCMPYFSTTDDLRNGEVSC